MSAKPSFSACFFTKPEPGTAIASLILFEIFLPFRSVMRCSNFEFAFGDDFELPKPVPAVFSRCFPFRLVDGISRDLR